MRLTPEFRSGCRGRVVAYDRRMQTENPTAVHYRLGLNQPIGSPTARRLAEMAEAIGRDTGGAFRLDVFPESRLGPDPQMFADMRDGKLEFFCCGRHPGRRSRRPARCRCCRSPLPIQRAVFAALDGALGDQIRGELAQHGIHAFRHCLQNGFHHLTTSNRPIGTAADFAGVKIRSPGRRDRPRFL